MFEALACGIPLVSAPWEDSEGLFEPGRDYLVARDGAQMHATCKLCAPIRDYAQSMARHGLQTIRARHTCAHRVRELLSICRGVACGDLAACADSFHDRILRLESGSAYWNGAATYYRGIIRALHERGHRVTFYEPDVFDRQAHRDMEDPPWAKVVVYQPR